MEYFEKETSNDVLIEKVNLSRATVMEANSMKDRLLEDIDLKHKKIIVDVSNCSFIDSTFLGAIVFSLKRSRNTGGDIKLVVAPSTNSEEVVNLSCVRKVFDIYNSIEEAIQGYKAFA